MFFSQVLNDGFLINKKKTMKPVITVVLFGWWYERDHLKQDPHVPLHDISITEALHFYSYVQMRYSIIYNNNPNYVSHFKLQNSSMCLV